MNIHCKNAIQKAFQPEFGAHRGLVRVLRSPLNPQNCRNKQKILKGHYYFLRQILVCTKPWFKRDLSNCKSFCSDHIILPTTSEVLSQSPASIHRIAAIAARSDLPIFSHRKRTCSFCHRHKGHRSKSSKKRGSFLLLGGHSVKTSTVKDCTNS